MCMARRTPVVLTVMFVLAGMLIIHSGVVRFRNSSKVLGFEVHEQLGSANNWGQSKNLQE